LTYRRSNKRGAMLVHVEPPRPDELPAGVAALHPSASADIKRDALGRLADAESARELGARGGAASAGKTRLARRNALGAVFADPRFELTIGDGAAYARDASERFDVVLVDSTDPVGPGAVLFTREFYRNVRERLNPGGVLVTQNGVPFLQAAELASAMRSLGATFRHVAACAIAVPTYFGGHLVLGVCSDDDSPFGVSVDELERRYAEAKLATRYYSPRHHRAAFVLPRYIEEALDAAVEAGRAESGRA